MNLGLPKSNVQHFLHKLTVWSSSKIKLDHINPISQFTTTFAMPLFPPTPVEASLLSTWVTRKTEIMK